MERGPGQGGKNQKNSTYRSIDTTSSPQISQQQPSERKTSSRAFSVPLLLYKLEFKTIPNIVTELLLLHLINNNNNNQKTINTFSLRLQIYTSKTSKNIFHQEILHSSQTLPPDIQNLYIKSVLPFIKLNKSLPKPFAFPTPENFPSPR